MTLPAITRRSGGRLLLATLAILAAGPVEAQAPMVRESMLVSADWLRAHHTDPGLVILHVDRERAGYHEAHIPGARFVAYSSIITTRGDLSTELPPVDDLRQVMEAVGVSSDSRVILTGELLLAARLWFTLDYLGHGDRAALLDGGTAAWTAAGGELTAEAPPVTPGRFVPAPRPAVVADLSWVREQLDDQRMLLLDARTTDEYTGARVEEGLPRAGHLPGAVHLDWTTTLADGMLKASAELRPMFEAAGAGSAGEVVTYCRVGTRAAMLYFVSRYLGYQTRLYDGSMNEWSGVAELPVVTGTSPRP